MAIPRAVAPSRGFGDCARHCGELDPPLEGFARAREHIPKRRRDEDAHLHEEYVKMHTLGEADGVGVDGDLLR